MSVEKIRKSDRIDREDASSRPWTGGTCPVAPEAEVEVNRRYAPTATGPARQFNWHHDLYNAYGAEDVIAYRVIAHPPPDNH